MNKFRAPDSTPSAVDYTRHTKLFNVFQLIANKLFRMSSYYRATPNLIKCYNFRLLSFKLHCVFFLLLCEISVKKINDQNKTEFQLINSANEFNYKLLWTMWWWVDDWMTDCSVQTLNKVLSTYFFLDIPPAHRTSTNSISLVKTGKCMSDGWSILKYPLWWCETMVFLF